MIFWKWWTSIVLVGASIFAGSYYLNIVRFVLENDPTYITVGIAILFVLTTLWIGLLSWRSQNGAKLNENDTMPTWFIADAVMSIGMVGTLLGFLIVLTSAFENVDTSDTQAMQDVIGQLASGMGTALLTSLMGLISSVILKFQLVMLESNNAGEDNA